MCSSDLAAPAVPGLTGIHYRIHGGRRAAVRRRGCFRGCRRRAYGDWVQRAGVMGFPCFLHFYKRYSIAASPLPGAVPLSGKGDAAHLQSEIYKPHKQRQQKRQEQRDPGNQKDPLHSGYSACRFHWRLGLLRKFSLGSRFWRLAPLGRGFSVPVHAFGLPDLLLLMYLAVFFTLGSDRLFRQGQKTATFFTKILQK